MDFNISNTTENQVKQLIKDIELVENMYLDKNQILARLRNIIKNK